MSVFQFHQIDVDCQTWNGNAQVCGIAHKAKELINGESESENILKTKMNEGSILD